MRYSDQAKNHAIMLRHSGVVTEGRGQGQSPSPVTYCLGALKDKEGAKIRNCQCEILYKICKVQPVNKFKDSSNSGISMRMSPLLPSGYFPQPPASLKLKCDTPLC